VGGRRDLITVMPCDAAARIAHPLCCAEGIPLVGGGSTDLCTGFAKALRTGPRPDVTCRTVVGLFLRQYEDSSWDKDDPDYVPDSPPAWARVVDIGSAR
jgi:hypothetical protein